MEFISTKEASEKWGISERRVRALCAAGRIEGALRLGEWAWNIPSETRKPADGRTLRFIRNRNLRTGYQDFSKAESAKKGSSFLSSEKVSLTILEALVFDGISATLEGVDSILNLKPDGSIDFETCVMVLNMKSALCAPSQEMTEKLACSINQRILSSINEKDGGLYGLGGSQAEDTEAIFSQYSSEWSVLHPVARAAFLFSELLRVKPFRKANTQTAFVILQNELKKAGLPPAIFSVDAMGQLKAALSSTLIRGNCQALVSIILDSLAK